MSLEVPRLPSVLPLPLSDDVLQELVDKSKDWALMHGAAMRSKSNFSEDSLNFAPFVLIPSAFPRKEFYKAVELQQILNELMHRVAHNRMFLTESLKEAIQVDEFTGNLFKIYETVQDEGVSQPISLGLLRSDIMLESACPDPEKDSHPRAPYCCWKQVEINSIASGFGWLGPASAHIQSLFQVIAAVEVLKMSLKIVDETLAVEVETMTRFQPRNQKRVSLGLLRSDYMPHSKTSGKIKQVEINTIASSFGGLAARLVQFNRYVLQELGQHDMLVNLPENNALEGLCSGMLEAWKIYGDPQAAIMILVEDVTYNICDQRFHEFELRRLNAYVKIIRRTLTEIADRGRLGPDNELIIDDLVVAVVYFRAGYEPGHYHSQREWEARLLMERSQAIKSPSIHYHLAGTKKVQQALARPGAVEMFLGEASKIEAVKEIFTGLYSLDFDEFGDQAVQMALDSPERFVLKPQREGGGNNIYGKDVRDAILNMKDSRERTAWILMERIHPPLSTGYIVRPGGPKIPELTDLISELGIFGVIIGDSTKIFTNRQVGHMLRTKVSTANEGGVAAGLGALDSPYLVD